VPFVLAQGSPNKSLDRSADGLFLNLFYDSSVECNRRARSTLTFDSPLKPQIYRCHPAGLAPRRLNNSRKQALQLQFSWPQLSTPTTNGPWTVPGFYYLILVEWFPLTETTKA